MSPAVVSPATCPVRPLLPVNLQHGYTVHPEAVAAGAALWSLTVLGLLTAAGVSGA